MKKMIRMGMMVAAMFFAVTTVAKAQDAQQQGRRGGGGGAGRITAVLKDSMKVSDAIVAKADSIQKAYATQTAPLMEAMRGGDADARTKMTELRNKQTADIKALLNDEQKAQFDKIMAASTGPPPRCALLAAPLGTHHLPAPHAKRADACAVSSSISTAHGSTTTPPARAAPAIRSSSYTGSPPRATSGRTSFRSCRRGIASSCSISSASVAAIARWSAR
jgi:hypothetical protein